MTARNGGGGGRTDGNDDGRRHGSMDDHDDRLEEELPGALRRAAEEARPRAAFRAALRERFAAGTLVPPETERTAAETAARPGAPAPGEPATTAPRGRLLRPSRWWIIPVTAAAAMVAVVALQPEDAAAGRGGLSGLLYRWFGIGGGGSQQVTFVSGTPTVVVTPTMIPAIGIPPSSATAVAPSTEARHRELEDVFTATETRLDPLPGLGNAALRHLVIEGRPVLLHADLAFGDYSKELERVCEAMTRSEAVAAEEFPGLASRGRSTPVVCVVANTRQVFEAVVAPRVEPLGMRSSIVAFALREEGVLLLSPEVLDPEHPPCETMDIAHETVHAWLHARTVDGVRPPLWLEEGAADLVAASSARWSPRPMWRKTMASLRSAGLDPFPGEVVLSLDTYPDVVRHARSQAPCEERPDAFLPVFHGQADTLLMFLADTADGTARRDAMREFLKSTLEGESPDPEGTARALGFADVEAMFAARDAWLDADIGE